MPAITIRAVKFMLMAQDMPRVVACYRDVLGLEPVQEQHRELSAISSVRFESPHKNRTLARSG